MLYTERAELILQQLQLQAVVKISDLAELPQVTVDTWRRALKPRAQNALVRTRLVSSRSWLSLRRPGCAPARMALPGRMSWNSESIRSFSASSSSSMG